jgi:hypothetical protein
MPPPPATPAQANTRRNIIFAFWVQNKGVKDVLIRIGGHIPWIPVMVEDHKYLQSETAIGAHG